MTQHNTFTVILPAHDEGEALQQNLPLLLGQEYSEDYDVVVIDASSADNTPDVLKQFQSENSRLYTTFLPKYQYQTHPRRLALTLGVKAAKGEWLVFLDPTTALPSEQWLQELAAYTQAPTQLLTGYINRKNGDVKLRAYDDLSRAAGIISKTERWRLSKGGRWKTRLLPGGGYDFIVVKHSLGHDVLKFFEV